MSDTSFSSRRDEKGRVEAEGGAEVVQEAMKQIPGSERMDKLKQALTLLMEIFGPGYGGQGILVYGRIKDADGDVADTCLIATTPALAVDLNESLRFEIARKISKGWKK